MPVTGYGLPGDRLRLPKGLPRVARDNRQKPSILTVTKVLVARLNYSDFLLMSPPIPPMGPLSFNGTRIVNISTLERFPFGAHLRTANQKNPDVFLTAVSDPCCRGMAP